MPNPVLYVFAISHYCEKARWALDYLGVRYDIRYLAPGLHSLAARRLGARRSALPILEAAGELVQGSGKIIDWAEALPGSAGKCLTPEASRDDCIAIEKRLDAVAGVHARRYYYSEALVDHPASVRPILTADLGVLQKAVVGSTWGLVRRRMISGMDLGPAQGQESRRILDAELDWLDDSLADGRQYLAGEQFSRADLTAASLLAPLVLPPEHPAYASLVLPPRLSAEMEHWRDRPSLGWVRRIYASHRRAA